MGTAAQPARPSPVEWFEGSCAAFYAQVNIGGHKLTSQPEERMGRIVEVASDIAAALGRKVVKRKSGST